MSEALASAPPAMPVVDYTPRLMRVESLTDETPDTRTFRLVATGPADAEPVTFKAGQFGLYSVAGCGEAVFCIASSPTREGYIECSVKRAGKVTAALHELNQGDTVGFRGPYGNHFPLDQMEGHPIVFVAGGIGLAPVRSVIWNVLDQRDRFGDITIVYGARSVADLVYRRELDEWQARSDLTTVFTVDPGGENDDWQGAVGFVPTVLKDTAPCGDDAFAIICGPPVMIRFTLPVLLELGFDKTRVFTTLENRMKCGVGKCGRCNVGSQYVCKDGPVFTAAQIETMPRDL